MNNEEFKKYKEKWKDDPNWGCFHCGRAIVFDQTMLSICKEEVAKAKPVRRLKAGTVYFHEACFESIASPYWNIDLNESE